MKSLPIGVLLLVAVLAYTLSGQNLKIFLNLHSIILVFFGTFGVLFLATPTSIIKVMFRAIKNLFKNETSIAELQMQLLALGRKRNTRIGGAHPLVAYAQELWEQGIDPSLFRLMLAQRMEELNGRAERGVASLRNLAKYPPALGMTGTVVGLVNLFSSLGPDAKSQIGPALALAMTATFYGLILANGVVMPLADRLQVEHLNQVRINDQVFQGLLLIHAGEPLSVFSDASDEIEGDSRATRRVAGVA